MHHQDLILSIILVFDQPFPIRESHTAAQLTTLLGSGAGSYFGEIAFWRRFKGVRLGKRKWATPPHAPGEEDTSTIGELWEARWCFDPKRANGDHHSHP